MKKIVWTDEAVKRLFDIEEYISQDNPERAVKLIDDVIKHTETILSGNPEIGRTVPETENTSIRELVFNRYRIVYRLNKNKIEILTVFEGHRLLKIEEIEQ